MNCQQFILESVVEMAAYVAPMQPFDVGSDESWTEYEEHFDNFLIANKITELDLKHANLLATIGSSGYKLLQSLCQNNTRNKTYEELLKVMSDHLHPTPNVIAERYRFYKRDRKNGESVAMYVSELRKFSEHCQFGAQLNDYLHDRLVCGLNCERVQQKLLRMKDLTLESALDTAISFELASKDAKILQGGTSDSGGEDTVYRVGGQEQNQGRRECYRCGSTIHLANVCPFRTKQCFGCSRIGHTRRKCTMKANGDKRDGGSYKSGAQNVLSADEPSVGRVADSDDGSGGVAATLDLLELYPLQARTRYDPVLVEVVVNGKEVRMELDTGAAVSVMSSNVYERISRVGQDKLQKSKVTLKTYTGELVQPEGVGWVDVVYKQQRCRLPVTVVKGNVPMLFGRDWLAKLKLDWGELFPAVAVNALQPNSH